MMNLGEHIMMMIMMMKIIIMIKFKTTMIRSNLYDCSDAYILVKGTITVPNMAAAAAAAAVANNSNKKVISKKCGPFTTCITEIHKQIMMKILI